MEAGEIKEVYIKFPVIFQKSPAFSISISAVTQGVAAHYVDTAVFVVGVGPVGATVRVINSNGFAESIGLNYSIFGVAV